MAIFISVYRLFNENSDKPFEALFSRFKRDRGFWGMILSKKLVMRNAHEQGPTEVHKL